jgi:menaquinone-dependent protoporphyrinogen oxidase
MGKYLLVYESKYGQTAKIAGAIAEEVRKIGHAADLKDLGSESELRGPALQQYDATIVGAPVYQASVPKKLRRWVSENAGTLKLKPSAFYSVCLGILEKDNPSTQAAEQKILTDFFAAVGWRPNESTIFPGALLYRKYNWLMRQIMKAIVKKAGGDTDTSRNYEYTDWDEVRRFARNFVKLVEETTSRSSESRQVG